MGQGPHPCRQGGQRTVGAKSPETSKEGALEQWRLLGGQQGQQKQEDWGQGERGQRGRAGWEAFEGGGEARAGWGLGG